MVAGGRISSRKLKKQETVRHNAFTAGDCESMWGNSKKNRVKKSKVKKSKVKKNKVKRTNLKRIKSNGIQL